MISTPTATGMPPHLLPPGEGGGVGAAPPRFPPSPHTPLVVRSCHPHTITTSDAHTIKRRGRQHQVRPHVQTSRPTPRARDVCTSTPRPSTPTNPTGSPNRSGRPPGAGRCQTYRQRGHRTPRYKPCTPTSPNQAATGTDIAAHARPATSVHLPADSPPPPPPTQTGERSRLSHGPKEVTPSG